MQYHDVVEPGRRKGKKKPLLAASPRLSSAPKLTGHPAPELQSQDNIFACSQCCRDERQGREPVLKEAGSSSWKSGQGCGCGSSSDSGSSSLDASKVRQEPADLEPFSLIAEGSIHSYVAETAGDWLQESGRNLKS